MKILHVANFNKGRYGRYYYSFDYKLTNGFIRNGHYVYDFCYRDTARTVGILKHKRFGIKKMNAKLLETVANIRPDLLLLGSAELISPETLDNARQICPNIRIALWYVDPLKGQDDKVAYLKLLVEKVDTFFCTSAGSSLAQFNPRNSSNYLPNVVDPSLDSLKNHTKNNFQYDIIFIGSDGHDEKRRKFLKAFSERASQESINLGLFGAQGTDQVRGNKFIETLSQSPMSISIGRITDVKWYTSDRIGQLTGNGLLTFSSEVNDFRTLYNDDELVYFGDVDDLIEKVLYFKNNDQERQRIAENGYNRAHQCYGVERVTRFIEEQTFDRLSEDYEWIE